MELKDITVKRLSVSELPATLCFILMHKYKTDPSRFVVMFDGKQQVLFVNRDIPVDDAEKFLHIASYPDPYINNADCPLSDVLDYVYETYGWNAYNIIIDAYQHRIRKMMDAKAKGRADKIAPLIREHIDSVVNDDAPDVFDEMLVSHVWDAGGKDNHRTAYNQTSYNTKYVFYLGYLMGTGKIKV